MPRNETRQRGGCVVFIHPSNLDRVGTPRISEISQSLVVSLFPQNVERLQRCSPVAGALAVDTRHTTLYILNRPVQRRKSRGGSST
jgi:hypothetical protein